MLSEPRLHALIRIVESIQDPVAKVTYTTLFFITCLLLSVDFFKSEVKQQTISVKSFQHFDSIRLMYENVVLPMWSVIGKDAPRTAVLADFNLWSSRFPINLKVFSTCLGDPELDQLRAHGFNISIDSCEFYDPIRCDLHFINLNTSYDLIVVSQSFEHLYDPVIAAHRLYSHLKPGGFLFTSLPIFNMPHSTPFHISHWSLPGIVALFESVGFVTECVGGWGSKDYVLRLLHDRNWPDFPSLGMSLPTFENDIGAIVQVHILVRRSLRPPVFLYSPNRFIETRLPTQEISFLFDSVFRKTTSLSHQMLSDLFQLHRNLAFVDFVAALLVSQAVGFDESGLFYFGLCAAEGFKASSILAARELTSFLSIPSKSSLVVFSDALEYVVDSTSFLRNIYSLLWSSCTPLLIAARSYMPLAHEGLSSNVNYTKSFQPTGLVLDLVRSGFTILSGGYWGSNLYAEAIVIRGERLSAFELLDGEMSRLSELSSMWDPLNHGELPDIHSSVVSWALANPCKS